MAAVVPIPADALRLLRVLRLLKLARYTPALPLFAAVIRNESRALLATLLVVAVLLVLEASIMYVLEREAQPKVFASIPHAMWWAIVTIATVGYGDMFPITPVGKVFGGMVMVIGIAVFAVPAGILATGFASEIRKRDFVVTWQTVANVPLFAGLDAARIAEIARLLKRQVVPAQFAVVRRGDPADAMFFIMAGEVQVDIAPTPVRLGRGQYFGEIALIRDTVRTATVTTLAECQLLSLDVADFRRLLENNPGLKATITRTAEERLRRADRGGRRNPGRAAAPSRGRPPEPGGPGSADGASEEACAARRSARARGRAAAGSAWASRLGLAALVAGLVAPPPATAQRVDRDRELRPLYDPLLGMDESGRIPKVPLPQDLPEPTRWRYIPEGRIMPGNAFERLFVSSFISPQIFFREDVGLGGGIAITDIDFREQRRREFLGAFVTYTTEGQERYRLVWRRWLYHREIPDGGVAVEERSFLAAAGGY